MIMQDLTRRTMLVSAAAAMWCWPRPERSALPAAGSLFRMPAAPVANESPFFASSFIDHDPALAYVHCPSICARTDGGLACAWYAGSREGGRDVAVWMAESAALNITQSTSGNRGGEHPVWGAPQRIVDRQTAMRDLDRYVDKVGNSVLFAMPDGQLWLVYVTIAAGGWSGSSLNACCSRDGGATWSQSQRLTLSPFFNISELVRAAPVLVNSGEIGLPVYHECIGKFPEMLWLRRDGERLVATKSRMAGGRSMLQPTIVPLNGDHAVAYLRNHSKTRQLFVQRTADAGHTWSPPAATGLANPDASVAAIRLSTGHVLIVFNNSRSNRHNLSVAIAEGSPGPDGSPIFSNDWQQVATLDDEAHENFAYPYMIQDATGCVHLVYSWKMKRIRHVAMNEAWILSQVRKPVT